MRFYTELRKALINNPLYEKQNWSFNTIIRIKCAKRKRGKKGVF